MMVMKNTLSSGDVIQVINPKTKMGIELEFIDAPIKNVVTHLHKNADKLGYPIYVEDELDHIVNSIKGFRPAKTNKRAWQIIMDSSVSDCNDDGESIGGEIVSPILPINKDSFRQIHQVIRCMNRGGAEYSVKTGIHIHLDLYGIDRFVLLSIWAMMSENIYDVFDERILNRFAAEPYKITSATRDHDPRYAMSLLLMSNSVTELLGEKYSSLHLYDRDDDPTHPMGEFRVGQMDEDPYLMTAWIKTCCQTVVEASHFRDALDFLEQRYDYSFKALNNRSPSGLRWSMKELDAMDVYI